MKVIFAGTPEFARVALERLCAARFEVPLVLTQPDRPAGRGMKEQAWPPARCFSRAACGWIGALPTRRKRPARRWRQCKLT